jgi:SH3 domain-containing YSC84-like protein 1
MRHESITTSLCAVVLVMLTTGILRAQDENSSDFRDAVEQSAKAARVFTQIMTAPDQEIPGDILNEAECVMVFPEVIKAGFIVGGRGGRGVGSCRTADGWSAPAFFDLKGGSIGLQIGAQSTDFVLLVMNEEGMGKLLGDNFEIGADASVAAGPVGRQAGASTNIRMDAQILSYSRSKGLFAGLELKGVVINPDEDDMLAVYGNESSTKVVLGAGAATKPSQVRTFSDTLARYSAKRAD